MPNNAAILRILALSCGFATFTAFTTAFTTAPATAQTVVKLNGQIYDGKGGPLQGRRRLLDQE